MSNGRSERGSIPSPANVSAASSARETIMPQPTRAGPRPARRVAASPMGTVYWPSGTGPFTL